MGKFRQFLSSVKITFGSRAKILWKFLLKILFLVLGQVQWQKPTWMRLGYAWYLNKFSPFVRRKIEKSKIWSRGHKKQIRWASLAVLFTTVSALYGYLWWQKQPKPRVVDFMTQAPERTYVDVNAKPNPLRLKFSSSVAPLEKVGKIATSDFDLSPKIEGVWRWESDSLLVFSPAADWPIDQKYVIKLDSKAFAKHLKLSQYKSEFRTAPFSIVSKSSEFYQHPEKPKDKRVIAKINLSHPVDPSSLKGKVRVRLHGDKALLGNIPSTYEAVLTYSKLLDEIHITSDVLPLPLKETTASIELDAGWAAARGGNSIAEKTNFEITVPGMLTYFKISSVSSQFVESKEYELEQVIAIETSTEVLANEFEKHLEMYVLPKDKPADSSGSPSVKNHSWQMGQVTPEILKASQSLKGERIVSERPQTLLHAYKVKVPPGSFIYVKVNKGLKSFHEYVLAESNENIVTMQKFPQEIRILAEGGILALSGEKKLSILTRGVKSIQIEVGHVLANQLNHLLSQTNGDFANPRFQSSYTFNWENISEKFTEVIDVSESQSGKPEFSAFDAGKYLAKGSSGGRGLLYVSLRAYNREKKTAFGTGDSRFILVSDLGIIEKKMADNSHEVFVESFFSGSPVSGATINLIGKNGLPVASTTTDEQGRARLNDFSSFKLEKTPLAYVVQKGSDLSFLPINRSDRTLQYSRFDIGGLRTRGESSRLQAFISTDRGLYRPGESFHLAAIVRSYDWKTELENVPVEWTITDARNQEIYKETSSLDKNGFIELNGQTQETAFVGTYTASLFVVNGDKREGLLGSTSFRVEEFVPDRMKISSGFSTANTPGWVSPDGLKSWVRVMTLFGHPASKREVRAQVSLSPAAPRFSKYPEHQFFLPKTENTFNETLTTQETNEKGEVEYEIDLTKYEKGSYQVRFQAEAIESEGGRSVATETSIMVSPYKYFIGHKTESDLSYLKLDSTHSIEFIAVAADLSLTTAKGLSLAIMEKQWISVLTKQTNGTFKYQSVMREREVKKEKFVIDSKGTRFEIPTKDPGDYKIVIFNTEGTEVAHLDFSIVGQKNILGRIDRTSELQIKLSRNDYSVGEEVEMQIRAPYVGSGLITIERDKVYASRWFKTTTTNSIQKIRVPPGLEGNAYINVTFLRDIGSKEIFMSPLSYGVVPFSVDLKKRQLKLDVKVAGEVRPGGPLKIDFSASQKGKVVIFAVDEGLLQVARYKTPDPLKTFFQKRALEVETSQLLDLILPEYQLLKEFSASGGDGDLALSKNLNPFKRKGKPPVAFWSGIMDIDQTKRSVIYNVPDYFNGSLRVMALAVSPESIGVFRSDTLVRGDFILTPTVPFVLTPGDEAIVGLAVFNNSVGSGPNAKVNIEVKGSDQIEILDKKTLELEIPETKEVSTSFRVRAKDSLGVVKLEFVARQGSKSSRLTEDISLRPATPYRTKLWGGSLSNEKEKIELTRNVYPDFARRTMSVSFLPLVMAHGLLEYLTDFPYGCMEQLLSKAFPTLILGDKPDFGFSASQREKAFKNTISLLRQRQTSDGGFGLYWSYGESAEFPSVYATHYLVEAKDRGFGVPTDLQERVRGYLRGLVNRSPRSLFQARTASYALYLLARMGQSVGNEVVTLSNEINSLKLTKEWAGDLGAMYMAATYKLMHQDSLAEKLVNPLKPQKDYFSFFDDYHDQYINNAMMVFLLSKHFPDKLKGFSDLATQSFVEMLQTTRYSTLNSSMVILALEALSSAGGESVEMVVKVSEVFEDNKVSALSFPKSLFPKVKYSARAKNLAIESSSDLTVYYQAHQSGFDFASSLKPENSKIEIQREYRKPGTKDVLTKVKMGDEVEVHIKLRSLDEKTHNNIAVVDLFPSGFELVFERSTHSAAIDFKKPFKRVLEDSNPFDRRINSLWSFRGIPWLTPAFAQEDHQGDEADDEYQEGPPSDDYPDGESEDSVSSGPRAAQDAPRLSSAEIPSLRLGGSDLNVQFEDPREDRIVLYASVEPQAKEFIYKIKATNRGSFTVPPVFAESMYDKTVQSIGPLSRIEVEEGR